MATIDVTAAQMLEDVVQRLAREGVRLIVSGGPGQFRDIVGASGHAVVLRERTRDIDSAVAEAREDAAEGDGLG